jgi:hypothetical protein
LDTKGEAMKKYIAGLGILLVATSVFAGGDLTVATPSVAKIEKPCNNEGVYVDRETDLMWQDALYTDAEDGAYANNRSAGKSGTFQHAVRYCKRLDYAGYTDWRLPTADELMALHRMPGQQFMHFRDKDFWTSTPTNRGRYYVVFPADAYKYKRSKRESNYIRCVRCTLNK